jgi:alpha-L-fucosidase 2
LVVPTGGPARDDLYQKCVAPRYRVKSSSVGAARCGQLHGLIPQHGNADIFVAIFTSYETAAPHAAAVREVRKASRVGIAALERANRRWWCMFWQKSWADFGAHRDIQRYWTFSLYQTACLFGKAPVPGLYGLWYGPTDAPRSGIGDAHYAQDQNVQIPSLPLLPLNHAELVTPFADTYLNVLPTLRRQTRQLFRRPGCRFPLCMNQLGQEITSGAYRYSLIGGPYSGIVLVWAWRYTRDRQLLREKLYPLLREIVRFHVAGMTLGAAGRYHLDWEIPPEISTLSRDCAATLGLLKPCLEVAVEASRLLRCDGAERRHWEEVLARFPEVPKRRSGDWWAGADVHPDHCVQAAYHLYPFFPGEWGDERTAARTLAAGRRNDIEFSYADTRGRRHYRRSWAWFFPAVTRIRLGEGWNELQECLRLFSKPNGLFSHNPFLEADPRETEANLRHIPHGAMRHADSSYSPLTEFWHQDRGPAASLNPHLRRWVTPASEGSGAFLFAATETLLQSHGGIIRLFPAVPSGFTGGFERLLAQGAIEVSARIQRGRVLWCRLTSPHTGVVKLINPWKTTPQLPRNSQVIRQGKATILMVPLRSNREIRLASD